MGFRTVPIEIGSSYTEEDWTQRLVNFSDFLQEYIIADSNEVGYLAQHQLFEQVRTDTSDSFPHEQSWSWEFGTPIWSWKVPELKDDFDVPLYCFFSDEPREESSPTPHVNSWLGPANTVSPLHYDRYNNLLCQVGKESNRKNTLTKIYDTLIGPSLTRITLETFMIICIQVFGYKRVILYSPDEAGYLYPHESRLLENTARVDPLKPDYDKWPNFRKANRMTFYLKPGEMLYIPPKWWHHVTALTPSFSISFWWT